MKHRLFALLLKYTLCAFFRQNQKERPLGDVLFLSASVQSGPHFTHTLTIRTDHIAHILHIFRRGPPLILHEGSRTSRGGQLRGGGRAVADYGRRVGNHQRVAGRHILHHGKTLGYGIKEDHTALPRFFHEAVRPDYGHCPA